MRVELWQPLTHRPFDDDSFSDRTTNMSDRPVLLFVFSLWHGHVWKWGMLVPPSRSTSCSWKATSTTRSWRTAKTNITLNTKWVLVFETWLTRYWMKSDASCKAIKQPMHSPYLSLNFVCLTLNVWEQVSILQFSLTIGKISELIYSFAGWACRAITSCSEYVAEVTFVAPCLSKVGCFTHLDWNY